MVVMVGWDGATKDSPVRPIPSRDGYKASEPSHPSRPSHRLRVETFTGRHPRRVLRTAPSMVWRVQLPAIEPTGLLIK